VTLVGFLRGDGFNVYATTSGSTCGTCSASTEVRTLGAAAALDELEAEAPLDAEMAVVTDESSGEVTLTISLSWT